MNLELRIRSPGLQTLGVGLASFSLDPHILLPSPLGFPATTLNEVPVASCWDLAITFLLVSASILPKADTAMKTLPTDLPCPVTPLLKRAQVWLSSLDVGSHTVQARPSGSSGLVLASFVLWAPSTHRFVLHGVQPRLWGLTLA